MKKGDLIAEFALDELQPSIREAAAQLTEAEALLSHAVKDGIELDLPISKASPADRDAVRHDLSAARARRDARRRRPSIAWRSPGRNIAFWPP